MDYIIGYLDDEYFNTSNMQRNMSKNNMQLLLLNDIKDVTTVDILVDFIIDNELGCLFVDYDLLKLKSSKYGTLVIKEIRDMLPDFPCYLLTSFVTTGEAEKIVPSIFVKDKDIFLDDSDSERFINFVNQVKNEIECFYKKLQISYEEYNNLFEMNQSNLLTLDDEAKFHSLNKILKGYHFTDEIPDFYLYKSTQEQINTIQSLLEKIENKLEKK